VSNPTAATGIIQGKHFQVALRRSCYFFPSSGAPVSKVGLFRVALLVIAALSTNARAQNPLRHPVDAVEARFSSSQPVIAYMLRVAAGDTSGFDVEVRIRNAPDTFRLAMAAHPEYDDRYWRFVEGLTAVTPTRPAVVSRLDSALWRIIAPGGEAVVRYRIRLPAREGSQRPAWTPFMAPTGALVGGPHAFMYMPGNTLAPSHVRLELPVAWDIATGLEPTSDPRVFFAPSADILIDSPILVGKLRGWGFLMDGVPHRIVYWPLPDAAPFDTTAFVDAIQRLSHQAIILFGRAPYREYTFLFQDGAFGALEHLNSVTIGAPSASLATNSSDLLEETAHEYIHAWNLMRIRPAERGSVDYRPAGQTRGLWWSEGLSMFYADLLLRRAKLPVHDSTRAAHLQGLIARYLGNAGNTHVSPERSSIAAYGAEPGSLGDYFPSVHLQGELVGAMLDLIIRDATKERRSIDDVMRAMMERYSGVRGFGGRDIENTVADVCGCEVHDFFETHVRGSKPIDFDRYLRLIGMRARVTWGPALDDSGKPQLDLRIWASEPPGEHGLRLRVNDPANVWARAGLHTGDRLVSVNGAPMSSMTSFRTLIRSLRNGETIRFQVQRPTGPFSTSVVVSGYQRPSVTLEQISGATARQLRMRNRWLAAVP
jgi:predicted metalloprotease with PDZ domain